MNFISKIYNKYRVIAGDVVKLSQHPGFRKKAEMYDRQKKNKEVLDRMKSREGINVKKTADEGVPLPVSKMHSKVDFLASARIKATTISVLMGNDKGLGSVGTHVSVRNKGGAEEGANLTLRFDQGDTATLCGIPRDWATWNEEINSEPGEETSYEDWLGMEGEFPAAISDNIAVYMSRGTEKEIFKQLKASLEHQFKDIQFKDKLPDDKKKLALSMMDKAISNL